MSIMYREIKIEMSNIKVLLVSEHNNYGNYNNHND